MLSRLVVLMEEQNQLLRELHVAFTGRNAVTPRGLTSSPPSRGPAPVTKKLSVNDVWWHTPPTESVQAEREYTAREDAASQSTLLPNIDATLPQDSADARKPDVDENGIGRPLPPAV